MIVLQSALLAKMPFQTIMGTNLRRLEASMQYLPNLILLSTAANKIGQNWDAQSPTDIHAIANMHRCWCALLTVHEGQNACQVVQAMGEEQQGAATTSAQHLC